jgi:hypothetical protein
VLFQIALEPRAEPITNVLPNQIGD